MPDSCPEVRDLFTVVLHCHAVKISSHIQISKRDIGVLLCFGYSSQEILELHACFFYGNSHETWNTDYMVKVFVSFGYCVRSKCCWVIMGQGHMAVKQQGSSFRTATWGGIAMLSS